MVFGDSTKKKLEAATDYTKLFNKMKYHYESEEEKIKNRILDYLKQGRDPPPVLPVFWKRNITAKRVYENIAESMEIIKDELKHRVRMKDLTDNAKVRLETKKDVQKLNNMFKDFIKDIETQGAMMGRFLEQMRESFLQPLIDIGKIVDMEIKQQDKLVEKAFGQELSKELLGEFLSELKKENKDEFEEIPKNFLDNIEV